MVQRTYRLGLDGLPYICVMTSFEFVVVLVLVLAPVLVAVLALGMDVARTFDWRSCD